MTTIDWLIFFTGLLALVALLYYLFIPTWPRPAPKPERQDQEFASELAPAFPVKEIVTDLPTYYQGDNRLVAVARDPETIFVYWQLDPVYLESLEAELPALKSGITQLRLYRYDETTGQWLLEDSKNLTSFVTSFYFHLARPDARYKVELGRLLNNQLFYCLLVSNEVVTPRAYFSALIDENWPPLLPLYQQLPQKERMIGSYVHFTIAPDV
ncbi:DUF4912 domain-containing protein [Carboxydocella sp. ULO1]|uniref:DUF4912 domain-containing protein n=1 Tax=Carboxydocella sp. ULO1 TaxID=1926599 RepID=UPI0009C6CD97|nr:DUF4912 domain-containing protein [Carboxydocella sp. ULO1]GAW29318.1 hypothetical protein ULO1_18880 [Carboxydocella sp. ULO1]